MRENPNRMKGNKGKKITMLFSSRALHSALSNGSESQMSHVITVGSDASYLLAPEGYYGVSLGIVKGVKSALATI